MPKKRNDEQPGIMEAIEMAQEREFSKTQWLEECSPEWGTYLNRQIEGTKVKRGKAVPEGRQGDIRAERV